MKKTLFLLAASAMMLFTACDKNDDTVNLNPSTVSKQALSDIGEFVITPTYRDLHQQTQLLLNEIEKFAKATTSENLEAVKAAWKTPRATWEKSEAFLFGPTEEAGVDPAIDSWPVNVEGINKVLNSNEPITEKTISQFDETRGFHLLEYLIWGSEETAKKPSDFTSREKEYMIAAAKDLNERTKVLIDTWPEYLTYMKTAGESGNTKFVSTRSAIETLIDGIIDIAGEVGDSKIQNPLNGSTEEGSTPDGKPHPDLEESRFSHNSKQDYQDNLESIRNVFLCQRDRGNKLGKGLYDVLVSINQKAMADEVLKKLTAAQEAIKAIPGTFSNAIFNHRSEVTKAQDAVIELRKYLDEEVKPTLQDTKNNI